MSKLLFNIAFTSKNAPKSYTGKRLSEYVQERKFFDLSAEYNYFSYILNGEKVQKFATAEDYFTKSNANEGLFDLDGVMSDKKIAQLKAKLSETESIIWHGFLSFDEETSKGFKTQEQAVKFMRQSFGAFLERTHLDPKNIELYAALHVDRPHHHHIHFAFFEKAPKRIGKDGKLTYTQKGAFRQEAIDNYLVSANMHLEEDGYDYYSARERAMDKLKAFRAAGAETLLGNEMKEKLVAFSKKLPETGRLQYNSVNMAPYQKEIDRLADALIRTNPEAFRAHREMERQLAHKEQSVLRLIRENKLAYVNGSRISGKQLDELHAKGVSGDLDEKYVDVRNVDYIMRLREDYRARLGNQVLGICKRLRFSDFDPKRKEGTKKAVNNRALKIHSRKVQVYQSRTLDKFLRQLAYMQQSAQADFTKTVQQYQEEIDREKTAAAAIDEYLSEQNYGGQAG